MPGFRVQGLAICAMPGTRVGGPGGPPTCTRPEFGAQGLPSAHPSHARDQGWGPAYLHHARARKVIKKSIVVNQARHTVGIPSPPQDEGRQPQEATGAAAAAAALC